jgi:hypothetical protein
MTTADITSRFNYGRKAVQLLSVLAFGVVTIEAKPLTMGNAAKPATEASCCARMMHNPAACPPASGMTSSSCCNMQAALQLFLQCRELYLDRPAAEYQWDDFVAGDSERSERPPAPPPRA